MAPSDIRFADTPNSRMPMNPHSIDSGITDGDDQRGADVAQEEEQHDDDQQRALDQVAPYRRRGAVDDVGLIVERHHRHAGRQRSLDLRRCAP